MKHRYRIKRRLFRAPLVVLQIKETQNRTDPVDMSAFEVVHWRDARAEDLMNGESVLAE